MNQDNVALTEGHVSCWLISFSAMRHVCSYTCPANRFRNSTNLAQPTSSIHSSLFICVHIFLFRMWLAPKCLPSLLQITLINSQQVRALSKWGDTNTNCAGSSCPLRHFFIPLSLYAFVFIQCFNPYPTAFPYGNGMVLHFYQQQESSTTKTVHKVINKGLKAYV